MRWLRMTLAVVLVSCLGAADGSAQGGGRRVPSTDYQLCVVNKDQAACARYEARRSSSGSALEADFKTWRNNDAAGKLLCDPESGLCNAVETTAAAIDGVREAVDGAIEGVRGLADGVLEFFDGSEDGSESQLERERNGVPPEAGPGRSPSSLGGAESVSDLRQQFEGLFAEDADGVREWVEAEDTARAAREAANERSQDVELFREEIDVELSRRRELAVARVSELDLVRSELQAAERNIEFAHSQYRASIEGFRSSVARAAAAGRRVSLGDALFGGGTYGGGGLLGMLTNGSGGGTFAGGETLAGGATGFGGAYSSVDDDWKLDCNEMVSAVAQGGGPQGFTMDLCQEVRSDTINAGYLNADGSSLTKGQLEDRLQLEIQGLETEQRLNEAYQRGGYASRPGLGGAPRGREPRTSPPARRGCTPSRAGAGCGRPN